FVMIVEEARAQDFGSVRLYQELAGWQRMLNTDGAVAACSTVSAALARLEQAYQQALPVLQGITPEELDHPFVLYSWRPDAAPVGTTLRQRVLRTATEHLHEHRAQLAESLARWRAAH